LIGLSVPATKYKPRNPSITKKAPATINQCKTRRATPCGDRLAHIPISFLLCARSPTSRQRRRSRTRASIHLWRRRRARRRSVPASRPRSFKSSEGLLDQFLPKPEILTDQVCRSGKPARAANSCCSSRTLGQLAVATPGRSGWTGSSVEARNGKGGSQSSTLTKFINWCNGRSARQASF
jgi:hypothetical protein